MSITISIPLIPPSQNELIRMHWAKRDRTKQTWQEWLCAGISDAEHNGQRDEVLRLRYAVLAGQRIRMMVTIHHSRMDDPGNLWTRSKLICDAAGFKRGAGLIYDDSDRYLDLDVRQEKSTRKAARTEIELST